MAVPLQIDTYSGAQAALSGCVGPCSLAGKPPAAFTVRTNEREAIGLDQQMEHHGKVDNMTEPFLPSPQFLKINAIRKIDQ